MNDGNSNTALTRREEFSATTSQYGGETGATAVAARERAKVEARYIVAMRSPRNWDVVRRKILDECERPTFANNKSAYYVKPIGDGAQGLGVRFAEVAIRHMTNASVEVEMVYEDAEKEVHRVTATDFESNVPLSVEVRVEKTVERRKAAEGQYLWKRKNSYGDDVYIVRATEDDLVNKRAALMSKAFRTQVLRLIPGDIKDEAEATILRIRRDKVKEDPAGARKAVIDGFNELNVPPEELLAFIGHAIDICSPEELVRLRGIYGAIRDGELTWFEVMEQKRRERAEAPPQGPQPKPKSPTPPPPAEGAAASPGASATPSETTSPAVDPALAALSKTADQVLDGKPDDNQLLDAKKKEAPDVKAPLPAINHIRGRIARMAGKVTEAQACGHVNKAALEECTAADLTAIGRWLNQH